MRLRIEEEFSLNTLVFTETEKKKVIITPFVDKNESSIQFSKKELRLIDSIIDKYGQLSADDLSEITHKPGGLWDIAKKI